MIAASCGLFAACGTSTTATNNAGPKTTPNANKSQAIDSSAPAGATPPNYSGSENASVVIEEFADFQCPQCGATYPIMSDIKSAYGTRIKFIYRNFPLKIPAHDKSYDAAVAAEAAGMQGKFFEMMGQLFTNQQAWTANPNYKQMWAEYAQKIGLNVQKWQDDCMSMAAKGRVDEDIKRGNAIGVNSTPTIFINNMAVPFSNVNLSSLKGLIDAELQKGSKESAPAAANAPVKK